MDKRREDETQRKIKAKKAFDQSMGRLEERYNEALERWRSLTEQMKSMEDCSHAILEDSVVLPNRLPTTNDLPGSVNWSVLEAGGGESSSFQQHSADWEMLATLTKFHVEQAEVQALKSTVDMMRTKLESLRERKVQLQNQLDEMKQRKKDTRKLILEAQTAVQKINPIMETAQGALTMSEEAIKKLHQGAVELRETASLIHIRSKQRDGLQQQLKILDTSIQNLEEMKAEAAKKTNSVEDKEIKAMENMKTAREKVNAGWRSQLTRLDEKYETLWSHVDEALGICDRLMEITQPELKALRQETHCVFEPLGEHPDKTSVHPYMPGLISTSNVLQIDSPLPVSQINSVPSSSSQRETYPSTVHRDSAPAAGQESSASPPSTIIHSEFTPPSIIQNNHASPSLNWGDIIPPPDKFRVPVTSANICRDPPLPLVGQGDPPVLFMGQRDHIPYAVSQRDPVPSVISQRDCAKLAVIQRDSALVELMDGASEPPFSPSLSISSDVIQSKSCLPVIQLDHIHSSCSQIETAPSTTVPRDFGSSFGQESSTSIPIGQKDCDASSNTLSDLTASPTTQKSLTTQSVNQGDSHPLSVTHKDLTSSSSASRDPLQLIVVQGESSVSIVDWRDHIPSSSVQIDPTSLITCQTECAAPAIVQRESSPTISGERDLSCTVFIQKDSAPVFNGKGDPAPSVNIQRHTVPTVSRHIDLASRANGQRDRASTYSRQRYLASRIDSQRDPVPALIVQRDMSPTDSGQRDLDYVLCCQRDKAPMNSSQREPHPTVSGQGEPALTVKGQKDPAPTGNGQRDPTFMVGGQRDKFLLVSGQGNPSSAVSCQRDPPPMLSGQKDPAPAVSGQGYLAPAVSGQRDLTPAVSGRKDPVPAICGQRDPAFAFSGQRDQVSVFIGHRDSASAVSGQRDPASAVSGQRDPAPADGGQVISSTFNTSEFSTVVKPMVLTLSPPSSVCDVLCTTNYFPSSPKTVVGIHTVSGNDSHERDGEIVNQENASDIEMDGEVIDRTEGIDVPPTLRNGQPAITTTVFGMERQLITRTAPHTVKHGNIIVSPRPVGTIPKLKENDFHHSERETLREENIVDMEMDEKVENIVEGMDTLPTIQCGQPVTSTVLFGIETQSAIITLPSDVEHGNITVVPSRLLDTFPKFTGNEPHLSKREMVSEEIMDMEMDEDLVDTVEGMGASSTIRNGQVAASAVSFGVEVQPSIVTETSTAEQSAFSDVPCVVMGQLSTNSVPSVMMEQVDTTQVSITNEQAASSGVPSVLMEQAASSGVPSVVMEHQDFTIVPSGIVEQVNDILSIRREQPARSKVTCTAKEQPTTSDLPIVVTDQLNSSQILSVVIEEPANNETGSVLMEQPTDRKVPSVLMKHSASAKVPVVREQLHATIVPSDGVEQLAANIMPFATAKIPSSSNVSFVLQGQLTTSTSSLRKRDHPLTDVVSYDVKEQPAAASGEKEQMVANTPSFEVKEQPASILPPRPIERSVTRNTEAGVKENPTTTNIPSLNVEQ
ncbi:uncharacterized protein [Panulirus ornatus]|uniref:uncharacterized protein n=1 Tax=Panulirus ornatus TaxID=150431 RepID=UPI003A8760EC